MDHTFFSPFLVFRRSRSRVSAGRRAIAFLQTGAHRIAGLLLAVAAFFSPHVSLAADVVTIAVSTVPHSLLFFVAEHEGYFAQDAPNIRLVDCVSGRKCLDMLLAGTVQLATAADTPIVSSSFARSDFVVLTTIATSSNDLHIVGAKAAGITKLRDLSGKKIGIIKGSSIEYFLDTVLLFEGIDPARVQKLDIRGDDFADALRQHKIDAFVLFNPFLDRALSALGDSVNVIATPPIYFSTFNLIAARSLVRKNDTDMVNILRALDRAQLFIKQQPEAAQRILRERLKTPPSAVKLINTQMDYTLSLDQTLLKTLEGEARWFSQQKGIVGIKPVNYLDFIYPSPLFQVRPKAVTIVK